jgi:uncharacterized protein with HEPN domain
MYSISLKDHSRLLNMLEAAEKIQAYTKALNTADELFADVKSFDAVLMNFIVIGEMVDKISEQLRDSTARKIDWFKIKGFRNILAHNYFGVDAEDVWQIIHERIPALQREIKGLIG